MFKWKVWSSNAQQEKHTKKYNTRIFPEYFQESAQSEGDVQEHNFQFPVNPEMEVNNEDGNIAQNIPGHFNINTGLWEYESLSKHTKGYHAPSECQLHNAEK